MYLISKLLTVSDNLCAFCAKCNTYFRLYFDYLDLSRNDSKQNQVTQTFTTKEDEDEFVEFRAMTEDRHFQEAILHNTVAQIIS